ncbi:MAG TPA: carboxypeptidase regulatory-like domain-containing protein [Planctomycetaceae bacterium]|jgi:hypothetical protein|nr:carboxypeptidase regulatory-like domain-containing protein [Planctomycetaceae bacterium]
MGRNVSVMPMAQQRLFCAWAARFWMAAGFATFLFVAMATSSLAAADNEGRYSFVGTVVDPQGKPVAGAKVWLDYWLAREPAQPAPPDAVSDTQGKFQFSRTNNDLADMAENSLWTNIGLVATKEGYGFAAGPLERFETTGRLVGDRPEVFRRRVGRAKREAERGDRILTLIADNMFLQGQLVNADGRPMAGATVEVVAVWEGENGTLDEWEAAFRKEPAWRFVSPLFWRYAGPGAIMYLNRRR